MLYMYQNKYFSQRASIMYLAAPDAPHYDIPISECRTCDTTFGKNDLFGCLMILYVGRVILLDKILDPACFPAADTSSFRIQFRERDTKTPGQNCSISWHQNTCSPKCSLEII